MAPTPLDSAEVQKAKLDKLYTEMGLRLQTMGFTPDEVLKVRQDMAAKTPKLQMKEDGTAQAKTPEITEQDKRALEWLKNNPNSPDRPGVEAALKAKGLL